MNLSASETRRLFSLLLAVAGVALGVVHAAAAEPAVQVRMPKEPHIYNARENGAKGDGKTDDTEALKQLLALGKDDKQRILYLPNGTYLVSGTLGWSRRRTVIGETRDGVVIKLKDACDGFGNAAAPKPVLHACVKGPYYGNDSQANAAFDNYIQNLTVDTGKGNPGAIAARYTTHNSGLMERVVLRSGDGAGPIGLDLTQTEFGPGMIMNLVVEGFDVGIKAPGNVSNAVFDDILLRGQRKYGLQNDGLPISIRNLRSDNKVPAIKHGPGGQLVLIGAELIGGAADAAAIEAAGTFYLRNVIAKGYKAALQADGQLQAGLGIKEFIPQTGLSKVLDGSPRASLGLPMQDPPPIFHEDPARWKMLKPTGGSDTAMLQQAMDSGAATIYLSSGKYQLDTTVTIPPTVRRIIGGFGAGLGGPRETFGFGDLEKPDNPQVGKGLPFLRVVGQGKEALVLEQVGAGCWPYRAHYLEIASPRPISVRYGLGGHPGGKVTTTAAAKGGALFLLETSADLHINGDYRVFAWQYNPENNPFRPKSGTMQNRTYIRNDGGQVWIFGFKTESPAIHAITKNGGRTEVLGGFFRDHFGGPDYGGEVPYFIVEDASTSATYLQYAWQRGKARALQMVAKKGGKETPMALSPDTFGVQLLRADTGR